MDGRAARLIEAATDVSQRLRGGGVRRYASRNSHGREDDEMTGAVTMTSGTPQTHATCDVVSCDARSVPVFKRP